MAYLPLWHVKEGRTTLREERLPGMKLATGKVVGGKIVVEGEPLEEGATVTILAQEDDETFQVGPREEAELIRRMQEMRQGHFVDGDELLRELEESE
jgi:hypothetical protein